MAKVVLIGGGPACLSAAYLLIQAGVEVELFEADPEYLGGISRTVEYKGFLFDIGGHRFFSKSREIEDFWQEILGDDLLERRRSSRIYYDGKFYSYPLRPFEAVKNLGLLSSALCFLSYLKARLFPKRDPRNFEEWVTNEFGERLYRTFFKTYTEKVWGIPCKEISADWAAQRIKGLSLGKAIARALNPFARGSKSVKSLISTFRYPRKGPGMMWERTGKLIEQKGGKIHRGFRVNSLEYEEGEGSWVVGARSRKGDEKVVRGDHVLSSAPMAELVGFLSPPPSETARKAGSSLGYRDFIVVALILKDQDSFDDQWVYIHDPDVKVGRVQNFKNWSPEMVPDPDLTCYGMEYFCFEGDGMWQSPDRKLVELARKELIFLGLAKEDQILDAKVVRQPKAYPVYDENYQKHVDVVRSELAERFPTLHLVGRNGMHKYNNQDHAMMTGMLTARNILSGETRFDVWEVNQDAEYHEQGKVASVSGLRQVPSRVDS